MPVSPDAAIEVTTFGQVPDFAQGLVRDLRVRWALEEAGLEYRLRLIGRERPAEYYREQPFGQVPVYRDETVQLFESGAIVQHIGESCEALLPRETAARARAIQWTYAALSSIEPPIVSLQIIDLFCADHQWAQLRRPDAEAFVRQRLERLSDWLGDKPWLEEDFTIGDLMMVTVLRNLRHTDLVAEFPNLAAYQRRGEARPAFQRALSDQLALYRSNQPQGEAA